MITEKLKKAYRELYGDYPKGWHLHHIKPVYMGGNEDLTNLIAVSPKRHAAMHTYLFELNGDVRDRDAAAMLLRDGVQPIDPVDLGGVDLSMFKGSQEDLDKVDMDLVSGRAIARHGIYKPQYKNYYAYSKASINDPKNAGFDTIIGFQRDSYNQLVGILYINTIDPNEHTFVEL